MFIISVYSIPLLFNNFLFIIRMIICVLIVENQNSFVFKLPAIYSYLPICNIIYKCNLSVLCKYNFRAQQNVCLLCEWFWIRSPKYRNSLR